MFVQVVKAQTLYLSVFLNGLRLKFCLHAPCEDFYIRTRLPVSDFHCHVNQWMGESSSGFGSKSPFFSFFVQIKFEEGVIGTPQVTDSLVLPEHVEFLGQKIDLSPFKGILSSVQDTASSVAKTISRQPPLKFSISNSNAQSWLLTTYLDEDLRISRADAGSVFVFIKEGSPLLMP